MEGLVRMSDLDDDYYIFDEQHYMNWVREIPDQENICFRPRIRVQGSGVHGPPPRDSGFYPAQRTGIQERVRELL